MGLSALAHIKPQVSRKRKTTKWGQLGLWTLQSWHISVLPKSHSQLVAGLVLEISFRAKHFNYIFIYCCVSIYVHVCCRGCGGAQRASCKRCYLFASWVLGIPLRSSGLVAGSFPVELSHLSDIVFVQFLISFSLLLVILLQHSWKSPCCMYFITLQSIMQA